MVFYGRLKRRPCSSERQATVQVGMPAAAVQAKIDYLLCFLRDVLFSFEVRGWKEPSFCCAPKALPFALPPVCANVDSHAA